MSPLLVPKKNNEELGKAQISIGGEKSWKAADGAIRSDDAGDQEAKTREKPLQVAFRIHITYFQALRSRLHDPAATQFPHFSKFTRKNQASGG